MSTFDEAMSFAFHAIGKQGLSLKPEQVQALRHVYDSQLHIAYLRLVYPLHFPGRFCLHPPAYTQALLKDCLYNVGGSLWLIPISAQ